MELIENPYHLYLFSLINGMPRTGAAKSLGADARAQMEIGLFTLLIRSNFWKQLKSSDLTI
jgi:hypothetical protein